MDNLCTAFLHSVPTAIKSNPKKLAKKLKEHFVERTFYFGTKNRHYYLEATPGNFVPLDKPSLLEEVTVRGLFYEPKPTKIPTKHAPKSQSATAVERAEKARSHRKFLDFLSAVRETHKIDWVGDLAGRFPGFALVNHVPCLILRGPTFIEPKKGDHLPVYNFIASLLGNDLTQINHFLACLRRYRRLLLEGRYEPMQVLIFGGTHDDGKTLLATEVIGPALGDRRVDASVFLTGDTRFNADLVKNELWLMDDHNESKWYDRRILESTLKKVSANPDVRAEPKGIDATNVRDLFRVVVCLFNVEGASGAHLIPPLSEDFKGKVQIFHTYPADLPVGSKQFQAIRKLIRPNMPAFLYWIDNDCQISAEVFSGTRYQIHAYHNPDICAQIDELSPAAQLLPILERWIREANLPEWLGNSTDLLTDMARDDAVYKTLPQACKTARGLGRAVTELCHRFPDKFFWLGDEHRKNYRILSEATAKQLAEAANHDAESSTPKGNIVDAKFKGR